jgi:hypothetical protein
VAPAGTDGAGAAGSTAAAGATAPAATEPDVRTGPGVGSVDYGTLTEKWGEVSNAIEDKILDTHREAAYTAVREEYGRYFDALEVHPRQLVGQEVPVIGGEGTEVLRDSADAAEWQEAVKQVLTEEIRDRATRLIDDTTPDMVAIHQAVELFQNNADLVPGTKQFDKELADRFAAIAEPYTIRVDGKLRGYGIPTQPLIDQLRTQLVAERKARATPATPSAPAAAPPQTAAAPAAAPRAPRVEQPQAGIPAKAGESSDTEDFSTLFGTIGLPNLRI